MSGRKDVGEFLIICCKSKLGSEKHGDIESGRFRALALKKKRYASEECIDVAM